MHSIMTKYNQLFLYHFTDKRNIDGIKEYGGILSFKELCNTTGKTIYWGGNDWSHNADRMNNVDDYVHLCFLKNHPMEYIAKTEGRIKDTIWISVKHDILLVQGVRFTNDVSNKSGVVLLQNEQAINEFDFEALFKYIDFRIEGNQERKTKVEKYEVLIPKKVPIKYLGNI